MINYTFIIPHKNSPNLLKRCIDSIPKRKDVQIIIVDDNSDENIVDFYNFPGANDECTEIYYTKEGKGAGYARNIGLKYAKGKWILFADADDYYSNSFINILDQNLTDNIDILYFNVYSIDNIEYNRAKIINSYYENYLTTQDADFIKYKIWAPWNKVFSCKLIKDYQIKFDEIKVGNDAMFCLHSCIKSKRNKVIQDKLYCITYQPNSISFNKMNYDRYFAYIEINIKINKFFLENNLGKYQIPITTPKNILSIYYHYGYKKTMEYIRYINKNFSIRKAFTLWFCDKFF